VPHVCDHRCLNEDYGHHAWPSPQPGECLCDQKLKGEHVWCTVCQTSLGKKKATNKGTAMLHTCDYRCLGGVGHHAHPAPAPDECLCHQKFGDEPVLCPTCANESNIPSEQRFLSGKFYVFNKWKLWRVLGYDIHKFDMLNGYWKRVGGNERRAERPYLREGKVKVFDTFRDAVKCME